MQNSDQFIDLLQINLWDSLDCVVSYLGAQKNVDQPLWWFERDMGGKEYRIVVKIGDEEGLLWDVIRDDKTATSWLKDRGLSEQWHTEIINNVIQESMEAATWNATRHPELKVVRGVVRRSPPLLWNSETVLRHQYWSRLVTEDGFGRKVDAWARQMYEDVTHPKTKEREKRVTQRVMKINQYRPDWEQQCEQSWHAWAHSFPKWTTLLKNIGVSFRLKHEGVPLPLWAIENQWLEGLKEWMNESKISALFVPSYEDIPQNWRQEMGGEGESVTSSLWHWVCRKGSLEMVQSLLQDNTQILEEEDLQGRTALHWACSNAREDIIDYLISQGANLKHEDSDGIIPAQLVGHEHDDLFERLEDCRLKNVSFSSSLSSC